MKVGLIDVDGHNFPNLALMKLSRRAKAEGHEVEWAKAYRPYDSIYASKVFTYTKDIEWETYRADSVHKGGTGYDVGSILSPVEELGVPDYSLYNCTSAYGFLTRGCIRKCPWCIVPVKEGGIRANQDIDEFLGGFDSAVLMDNNVLAHSHGLEQIEKIAQRRIKVDFNQGLDARLIAQDESIAERLGRVKWLRPLRLACDTSEQIPVLEKAIHLLRKHKAHPSSYFVYVLVQDIPSALERVKFLKALKCDPFAQPFIDFTQKRVSRRLKQFARWVNVRQLRNMSWEEYTYGARYILRENLSEYVEL